MKNNKQSKLGLEHNYYTLYKYVYYSAKIKIIDIFLSSKNMNSDQAAVADRCKFMLELENSLEKKSRPEQTFVPHQNDRTTARARDENRITMDISKPTQITVKNGTCNQFTPGGILESSLNSTNSKARLESGRKFETMCVDTGEKLTTLF